MQYQLIKIEMRNNQIKKLLDLISIQFKLNKMTLVNYDIYILINK